MPRLPLPGGDDGNWGTILNEFLSTVHNTDGTLKPNSVTTSSIAPGAINETALAPTGGADNDVLVKDSAATSGMSWKSLAAGNNSTPDATVTSKGVIQLAGDIAGTAAAVTVARVNGVAVSGTPGVGNVLTATGAGAASWQVPDTSFAALATRGGLETVFSGNATGATTLNLNNGNVFRTTLVGNTTFTFAGAVNGKACSFTLYIVQDGVGGRTVTWPAGTKWSGGAPVLTAAANAVDVVVFESIDGGTTWYGSLVGTNFS